MCCYTRFDMASSCSLHPFTQHSVWHRLDGEAWFCRKTSLTVEMVTDEAGACTTVRDADSTKHQHYGLRARDNFPPPSTVECHMPQEHRKVVKDHGVTRANGWPKLSRRLARNCFQPLFPSPLAERSVTVSVSLRSPAVKLVTSQQQVTSTPLWLSASRVPRGSFGLTPCAPSPCRRPSRPPW
jgi:hypothetical protein